MADYAADALALLDHVGWETCRIVGISFGGMVAQELAVTVPERVERLALVCTSPGGSAGASYPLHELADLDRRRAGGAGRPLLDTRFTPSGSRAPARPATLALMRPMGAERSVDTRGGRAREQLEARRHHDVTDRLRRITCPTFVACGRYDGIAPPANSEAIVARIPGAELRTYEGGHAFLAQDAHAFPDLIGFLRADG